MVGFNPDGSVANYSVLEHKETPGLGSKWMYGSPPTGKEILRVKLPVPKG